MVSSHTVHWLLFCITPVLLNLWRHRLTTRWNSHQTDWRDVVQNGAMLNVCFCLFAVIKHKSTCLLLYTFRSRDWLLQLIVRILVCVCCARWVAECPCLEPFAILDQIILVIHPNRSHLGAMCPPVQTFKRPLHSFFSVCLFIKDLGFSKLLPDTKFLIFESGLLYFCSLLNLCLLNLIFLCSHVSQQNPLSDSWNVSAFFVEIGFIYL